MYKNVNSFGAALGKPLRARRNSSAETRRFCHFRPPDRAGGGV